MTPASGAATGQGDLPGGGQALVRDLRKSQRRQRLTALALVLPLLLTVFVFFAMPIAALLSGAVRSPEVADTYPQSAAHLVETGDFDEGFYAALFTDLVTAYEAQSGGAAARRLNQDVAGFTTMISKTTRAALRKPPAEGMTHRDWFAEQDPRWIEPQFQGAIRRAIPRTTDFFLLRSLDLERDDTGAIVSSPENERIFVTVLLRTFTISLTVTVLCCVLGYPLAWSIAHARPRAQRLLLLGVLFPFWTSLLVRSAAWIIVLQREGPINKFLIGIGLIAEPLTLVFNRFGVVVALTHVLLPFMVLPLYSVMTSISPSYMRAAKSLGARPLYAFVSVYLPQTLPGFSAGAILVFIMAIGYYITPALVGGPNDQMISYFIAFYTNNTINWGLASALALNLLIVTLVLYALYQRIVGNGRIQAGVR